MTAVHVPDYKAIMDDLRETDRAYRLYFSAQEGLTESQSEVFMELSQFMDVDEELGKHAEAARRLA